MKGMFYFIAGAATYAIIYSYVASDGNHSSEIGRWNSDADIESAMDVVREHELNPHEEIDFKKTKLPRPLVQFIRDWELHKKETIPPVFYEAAIEGLKRTTPIGPVSLFSKAYNLRGLRKKLRKSYNIDPKEDVFIKEIEA